MALGCRSDLWIPNSFGAIAVRDLTGDGQEDCVAWAIDYDKLIATKLIVIDGATGKLHFAGHGTTSRRASLIGTRLVMVSEQRTLPKPPTGPAGVVPPAIHLWDVPTNETLATQLLQTSEAELVVVEDKVVVNAYPTAYWVDVKAGTIRPGERVTSGANPANVVDESGLWDELPSSTWRPPESLVARGKLRVAPDGGWVVIGLDSGTRAPVAARVASSEPHAASWRTPLTGAPALGDWVPGHVATNSRHWFVPYAAEGALRVAAIDGSSGALAWSVELKEAEASSVGRVCSMAAGSQLLGIVYSDQSDCDTLALVNIAAKKVAFRYRRKR